MKFGVTKTQRDTALPVAKKDLLLVYREDILQMPAVDERGILATSELILREGALSYKLYLTPAQQKMLSESEGDVKLRGFTQKISGSFPGTALSISEWLHNNINEEFIALVADCKNSYKIYGDPYNPLLVSGKLTEDKDNSLCEIEFSQVKKSKRPYIIYDPEQNDLPIDDGSAILPNFIRGGFYDITHL